MYFCCPLRYFLFCQNPNRPSSPEGRNSSPQESPPNGNPSPLQYRLFCQSPRQPNSPKEKNSSPQESPPNGNPSPLPYRLFCQSPPQPNSPEEKNSSPQESPPNGNPSPLPYRLFCQSPPQPNSPEEKNSSHQESPPNVEKLPDFSHLTNYSLRENMAQRIKTNNPNYDLETLYKMNIQTLNKIHRDLPPSTPPSLLSLLERRNYS